LKNNNLKKLPRKLILYQISIHLSLGLGHIRCRRSLQPSKDNMKFLKIFLFLWVIFALRIRNNVAKITLWLMCCIFIYPLQHCPPSETQLLDAINNWYDHVCVESGNFLVWSNMTSPSPRFENFFPSAPGVFEPVPF